MTECSRGKVSILQRQGWERRGLFGGKSRIQYRQFLPEDTTRPRIRDDVMHTQEQHILCISQMHQCGAQQWSLGQIKQPLCFRLRQGQHLRLTFAGREGAQIHG